MGFLAVCVAHFSVVASLRMRLFFSPNGETIRRGCVSCANCIEIVGIGFLSFVKGRKKARKKERKKTSRQLESTFYIICAVTDVNECFRLTETGLCLLLAWKNLIRLFTR